MQDILTPSRPTFFGLVPRWSLVCPSEFRIQERAPEGPRWVSEKLESTLRDSKVLEMHWSTPQEVETDLSADAP